MAILLVGGELDPGRLMVMNNKSCNIDLLSTLDEKIALELIINQKIELVIIDTGLHDIKANDLAKKIKYKKPEIPFLSIISKNNIENAIGGLKYGSVEYIVKPFDAEELIFRISIALNRNKINSKNKLNFGNSFLKLQDYKLNTPSNEYRLTQKESDLLAYFINNKNKLIKRDIMLSTIWGQNDYFLGRSMDVFISRLRKLLRDDSSVQLETFRRVGYIFKEI